MPPTRTATIRHLAASDREPVKRLWAARFGGDDTTQNNWIDAALASSRSAVGLVATASSDDTVVGVSFLDVGDPSYTRRYLGLDVLDLTAPIVGRNGIFHLSCVATDWEGRGIGSRFYQRRLDILRHRDVSRAFGIAWHRPHTVDSRALFEKYKFTRLATVERYYTRTSGRPYCPDCEAECTCTASLYARPVS